MGIYREVNYTIAMENDWKIAYGPKGYAFAIKREDNSDVCTLHNGLTPQDKALAQLISATPDLLEALYDVVNMFELNELDNDKVAIIQNAWKAIDKATGANHA